MHGNKCQQCEPLWDRLCDIFAILYSLLLSCLAYKIGATCRLAFSSVLTSTKYPLGFSIFERFCNPKLFKAPLYRNFDDYTKFTCQ